MKTKCRILFAALPAVGLLGIALCAVSARAEEKKPVVGLVMKSLANEFFKSMEEGARKFAAQDGTFTLVPVGMNSETDIDTQISAVENFITQKVDIICVAPADSVGLVAPVKKALGAGITVVNFDVKLDDKALAKAGLKDLVFVGPDNKEGAYLAGQELAKKLGKGGKVFIIEGNPGADNAKMRKAGFDKAAKEAGLKILYDKTYPPTATDYTPIVRAIKATNADIVFVASYPPDSVGMLRAAQEIGLQPKIFGGGMVGLQFTSVMTSMGPMLNGIVNYDFWAPEPTMLAFPGVKEFLKEYQLRAEKAGVDPLGYYLPPYSYALVQVLGQAVEATKSLDQQKLADYIRATEFNTIVGKVKFGKNGEWAKGRTLMVQYQKIQGNGIEQFRGPGKKVVLYPDEFKSGNIIYPYSAAKN